MIIKHNEDLSKHTTFKTGGTAENFYIPESIDELSNILIEKPELYKYIISGGSNLLINDNRVFPNVLYMSSVSNTIEDMKNGTYYVGASVRIQKLIKQINADGYGGIEYLYSLPALLGGIVYMNAGRGKSHNQCISDYIISVDVIENGVRKKYKKDECDFNYRHSVFQQLDRCVIVGATLRFDKVSTDVTNERIRERIELCKVKQDSSSPNFGSVFCVSNRRIMKIIKSIGFGRTEGCHFSKKTQNWMLKGKTGTYSEAVKLINSIKRIHKLFGQKCSLEVKIWE